jgi:cytochrome c
VRRYDSARNGGFTALKRWCSRGLIAAIGLLVTGAAAGAVDIAAGESFARANCGRCHAVERSGDSPLPQAPQFRLLHTRYPIDSLAEALSEGIVTGHPDMPQYELESDAIEDLLAYIKSLASAHN